MLPEIIIDLKDQVLTYYDQVVTLLPKLALAIVVFILIVTVFGFVTRKLFSFLASRAEDPLLLNFFAKVLKITNYIIASLVFMYIVGLTGVAGSILAAAGVSAFVIGFAFKDIGENFLAGIIMAFKRPFRVGDTVESNGITGNIVQMSLRDTHLKTFDGKDVYIPNGQILKNPFSNFTIDGFLRRDLTIGVDYDTDLSKAREIIVDQLNQIDGILKEEKKPSVYTLELGSSTINLTAYFWIDTFDNKFNALELHSEAIKRCLNALNDAGINMPGDILEVKNYNQNTFLSSNK